MPEAVRGARRIHYAVAGTVSAGGEPILLLPGIGGGARMFGTLPRRFARAGFQCITYDPVGVAPSSPHAGDYDLHAAGRDVLSVLDDLDLERCALVGTSLGGKVGLCAASEAPARVSHLVLLACAAIATPRGRRIYRFFEILAGKLEGPEFGEVLATFLFGTTFHRNHPKVIDDIVRSLRLDPAARALMVAQARCLHDFDGSEQARKLACPALCLAGAEDTITGPECIAATAKLMPRATFAVVPNAGHTLLLEAPQVFDQIVGFVA